MRSETVTAVLDAPRDEVFEWMAEIENLPRWANEFARELVKDEQGRWKVRNGLGEFFFEIDADPATGVIDMLAGPEPHLMMVFPTRAVDLPGGKTAYMFTMFQGPDQPNEQFEAQHASLQREFANIAERFG
jgi:hypothetical protein